MEIGVQRTHHIAAGGDDGPRSKKALGRACKRAGIGVAREAKLLCKTDYVNPSSLETRGNARDCPADVLPRYTDGRWGLHIKQGAMKAHCTAQSPVLRWIAVENISDYCAGFQSWCGGIHPINCPPTLRLLKTKTKTKMHFIST